MNYKYCLTGMLLLSMKVWGQEIKVGNKVPAIKLNTILNYPHLRSNLSAFNNKLVILDFMATNCSSCIKVLPHFDSLQNLYGDKLQVFLVTYEKKDKIKKFLQKHPALKLPVIGEDTTLAKYFPHTFISHEVWIKDGVVKAITYPEYVTAGNIATVLAKFKVDWPVKKDIANFDYSKPLITYDSRGGENNFSVNSYTTIFKNIENVPPKFTEIKDTCNNIIRLSIINRSIIDLYLHSLKQFDFPSSHIILEVKDKDHFVYDGQTYPDAWMRDNTWCFESVMTLNTPVEKRQHLMQKAMDEYFHLHGRFEKRKVQCLVLKKAIAERSLNNEGQKTFSLEQLVYSLNHTLCAQPVFDETGLDRDEVKIQLEDPLPAIPSLNNALKKYGMQLITEEREVEMFIITENNF
jgi:Thiol-disulfide isomerase and thioredoxins